MNEKPAVTQIQFVTEYSQWPFSRQLSVERFARDNIRFCFGDENLDRCDSSIHPRTRRTIIGDLAQQKRFQTAA